MVDRILWALLAAIHAMPAWALVRPTMVTRLYRLSPDNPLFLLLHHRAALFAAVFLLALWAVIDPSVRRAASLVTAVSMVSFLILWLQAGAPDALRTIARVDMIGIPILALAVWRAFSPT